MIKMSRRHQYEMNNLLHEVVLRGFAVANMSKLEAWLGPDFLDPTSCKFIEGRFRKLQKRFLEGDEEEALLFMQVGIGEVLFVNGEQLQNIKSRYAAA